VASRATHPDGCPPERKAELRRRILDDRRRRPAAPAIDAARTAALLALPEVAAARVVAAYAPLRGEPDLRPLLEVLTGRGVRVVLPELLPDRDLRFGDASGPVDEADIDVMLVPAVAADPQGRRLGRGGGSYDRVLPRVRALTIAVVHAEELLPEVPVEPHDARVDAVLAGATLLRATP